MRIVLLGPPAVGKSTVAEILSDRLGLPHAPMDRLRFGYYAAEGYDAREERRRAADGGFPAVVAYWKQFQPGAAEKILAHYPEGVIDFGAGDGHHEDPVLFERVSLALVSEPNVVLLRPSEQDEETLRVIRARLRIPDGDAEWGIICGQVQHPSHRRLAKHLVITGSKSPEQVADAVLVAIGAVS